MEMLKLCFFGLTLLCLFSTQLYGQKKYTVFKGVVSDTLTDEKLRFTRVTLRTTANRLIGRDTTDSEGRFEIDSVPSGRFYAEFQLHAYDKLMVTGLVVKPDSVLPINYHAQMREDKLFEGLHFARMKKDRIRDLRFLLPTLALFVIGVQTLK